jgi:hypothetical protein
MYAQWSDVIRCSMMVRHSIADIRRNEQQSTIDCPSLSVLALRNESGGECIAAGNDAQAEEKSISPNFGAISGAR